MIEFHQTLQTHWYPQDEHLYFNKKGYWPVLLELLPFIILKAFCLWIDSAYAGKSTCTTAFAETIWYLAYTV